MPDSSTWGSYPYPTEPEACDTPANLMALVEALDPHTVQFATSVSDRNAKYNGLPAGGIVSCAALQTSWRSLGGTPTTLWQTTAYDSGWVTSGFTYPNSDWSAGDWAQTRNVNGTVELRMSVMLAGSNITATSSGNVTDATIASIPVGFRPTTTPVFATGYFPGVGATLAITASGNVRLVDTEPNYVVVSGTQIQLSAIWLDG